MSPLKILISGASIAGPATAYWFAKAGASVTIIERFPSLRTNGQNIDIRTIGVSVMRKMPGMEAAVRAMTVEMDGIQFVTDEGRPYATMTSTGDPDQQSLVSEYEIYRGDLAKVLVDLTERYPNVEYVFGEQIASMQHHNSENANEDDDGPITVDFLNGKLPTTTYDLVIACDGATSRTRAMGLNCGVREHITPMNVWAAYFSLPHDLLNGSKMGHGHSAVGGRFFAVGRDAKTGGNRVTFMAISPRGDHDALVAFREAMRKGDGELKRYVKGRFEGAGWKIDEVLEGMMASEDFYASEIVQVKPPSLSKGRFVMVGDAGYAPGMTGGGTSLALAGAYYLAGEVLRSQGDLPSALRGYEERMRPVITDLQKIPPFVGTVMAPQTWWGIWVRDTILVTVSRVFWFLKWTGIAGFLSKTLGMWAGAFASSEKYQLPDYEWVA